MILLQAVSKFYEVEHLVTSGHLELDLIHVLGNEDLKLRFLNFCEEAGVLF